MYLQEVLMNVKIPKAQTSYKNIAELFGQRYRRIHTFCGLLKVRFTGRNLRGLQR